MDRPLDINELYSGKKGDSLFNEPFLPEEMSTESTELMQSWAESLPDERLRAITTALVVENRIDKILSIFLPKYGRLLELSVFGFSSKIRLLEALNLVPIALTSTCHCVRNIRNEFAHNLSKKKLGDISRKHLATLNGLYKAVWKDMSRPAYTIDNVPFVEFFNLSLYCIAGLDKYVANVALMREAISRPEFVEQLRNECSLENKAFVNAIVAKYDHNFVELTDTLNASMDD
ncbi:hypothetical protein SAMN05444166_2516 [Singulisphaera sp. GP187]|uniref:hypothetical protein n=1 Tax=Singulisphaera sp. GP187 TaxID=1882752 RepID=UPI00092B3B6E|nr:hypothetical protein [Singulisphaera sp. GP187]SIO11358.1 hypothetical protein SAMN05444166_2516 [Singulisphaera sp. GP187]